MCAAKTPAGYAGILRDALTGRERGRRGADTMVCRQRTSSVRERESGEPDGVDNGHWFIADSESPGEDAGCGADGCAADELGACVLLGLVA